MDANVKTPQDALEWLDGRIREEAELDCEMSNAHAIQLGFIQNMLAKFPRRNCDRFATVDEARKAHEAICEKYGKCHNGCPLNNEEHYSAFDCFEAWLFAQAEGGAK